MKLNQILKISLSSLILSAYFGCAAPGSEQSFRLNPEEPVTTEKFVLASINNVFKEYDLNKSGYIERNELSQAPNSFSQMDKNQDGRLSFDEVIPANERIGQISGLINKFYQDLYKEMDSDKNTSVSAAELSSNDLLEPFRNSRAWNRTFEVNSYSTMNSSETVSQQKFNYMMNSFFLDLSGEQPQVSTQGLWSWLKDKFSKDKDNSISTPANPNPVILVQGYAEPSWYFLYGIYRNLKKTGRDLYPVNLFPNIGDIREQAKIVADKIDQIKKESGREKIDYVCHSMGGLIGRYYIQEMNGLPNIDHYVSISTPHYGTYAAWLGIGEAAKQMRPNSEFLNKLNAENPIRTPIKYTSIWTKTDEIVIPAKNAMLQGSEVMPDVKFVGHLLILFAPKTYSQIREALAK